MPTLYLSKRPISSCCLDWLLTIVGKKKEALKHICLLTTMLSRQIFVLSCLPKPLKQKAALHMDSQRTRWRMRTVRLDHLAERTGSTIATFTALNLIADISGPQSSLLCSCYQPYEHVSHWRRVAMVFSDTRHNEKKTPNVGRSARRLRFNCATTCQKFIQLFDGRLGATQL